MAVKINVAFFEAFGVGRLGGARAGPSRRAARCRCASSTRSAATSARPRSATPPGLIRPSRRRRRHALAVPRRGRHRAVPGDRRPARLPAGANQQPIGAAGAGARGRRRAGAPPRGALGGRSLADGRVGLVVGATVPEELAAVRAARARAPAFLVPGVGAQGGDLDAAARDARRRMGAWSRGRLARDRGRLPRPGLARRGGRSRQVAPPAACERRCYTRRASPAHTVNHGGS